MKRGLLGILVLMIAAGPVWADDEPAVINDAPNAASEATDIIDLLSPTVEAVYDVDSGEWGVGTSASLYEFTSNDIHLGRIKGGYLSTNAFYAGVDVDIPGLVARTLDGKWVQLDTILRALAEYGSTGYVIGRDVDANKTFHGPTFGATLRF